MVSRILRDGKDFEREDRRNTEDDSFVVENRSGVSSTTDSHYVKHIDSMGRRLARTKQGGVCFSSPSFECYLLFLMFNRLIVSFVSDKQDKNPSHFTLPHLFTPFTLP